MAKNIYVNSDSFNQLVETINFKPIGNDQSLNEGLIYKPSTARIAADNTDFERAIEIHVLGKLIILYLIEEYPNKRGDVGINFSKRVISLREFKKLFS